MRSTFLDADSYTIVNLSEMDWNGDYDRNVWEVNRINTPAPHRGWGYASRLVRNVVLPEVDAHGATLWLWIAPSGSLDYGQLAAWYTRLGFVPRPYGDDGLIWIRRGR